MHHKFIVVDFDKPSARVYVGSYNFSTPADRENGENLFLISDRRVVTAFAVEALRIFDHCHFRLSEHRSGELTLSKPPQGDEKAWWYEYYSDPVKIHDRNLFCPLP